MQLEAKAQSCLSGELCWSGSRDKGLVGTGGRAQPDERGGGGWGDPQGACFGLSHHHNRSPARR